MMSHYTYYQWNTLNEPMNYTIEMEEIHQAMKKMADGANNEIMVVKNNLAYVLEEISRDTAIELFENYDHIRVYRCDDEDVKMLERVAFFGKTPDEDILQCNLDPRDHTYSNTSDESIDVDSDSDIEVVESLECDEDLEIIERPPKRQRR